jgi:hypothetical protein
VAESDKQPDLKTRIAAKEHRERKEISPKPAKMPRDEDQRVKSESWKAACLSGPGSFLRFLRFFAAIHLRLNLCAFTSLREIFLGLQ